MSTVVYCIAILLFITLQGFFAASEIAYISSNRLKLRHRVQLSDSRAQLALQLISNPEKFLATTLIGTNLAVIISSSLATGFLVKLHVSHSPFWITFLFTPLIVVFAELVPKTLGRMYRERFSCQFAPVIRFFENLLAPLVWVIERVSRLIIEMIVGKRKRRSFYVTKEEIKTIVREIQSEGLLDIGEKEAIDEIFDFRFTKIKDVITPLKKVVGVDYADSQEVVLEKMSSNVYTRLPVFRNKMIMGYINVFDLFYQNKQWRELIRPITCVGESQKLYEVLTLLKTKKENIGLVLRGKKMLGIVTIEDIVREVITSIVKY